MGQSHSRLRSQGQLAMDRSMTLFPATLLPLRRIQGYRKFEASKA